MGYGTPLDFDLSYYWGGNGSLISQSNNRYASDTVAGYGKNRDTVVLLSNKKTLSVFQVTNSPSCRGVRFKTPAQLELSWKLWDEATWRSTTTIGNNYKFTFPTTDAWWLLKVKTTSAGAAGNVDAICE